MSRKRARSASPNSEFPAFVRSSPISDRGSTFVGFYSPTLGASALQALEEINSATHRIAAWRKRSSQRTLSSAPLYDVGHDDDGEKYGGKRVERVLTDARIEGAIVVARWYGGVMLGPVRFAHMENCAKGATKAWEVVEAERLQQASKKQQVELDRPRIERVLIQRDQSIEVLRRLLAEKVRAQTRGSNEGEEAKDGHVDVVAPTKTPEYGKMSVAALRKLEKARDATLAYILKELDKIEAAETVPRKEQDRADTAVEVASESGETTNVRMP